MRRKGIFVSIRIVVGTILFGSAYIFGQVQETHIRRDPEAVRLLELSIHNLQGDTVSPKVRFATLKGKVIGYQGAEPRQKSKPFIDKNIKTEESWLVNHEVHDSERVVNIVQEAKKIKVHVDGKERRLIGLVPASDYFPFYLPAVVLQDFLDNPLTEIVYAGVEGISDGRFERVRLNILDKSLKRTSETQDWLFALNSHLPAEVSYQISFGTYKDARHLRRIRLNDFKLMNGVSIATNMSMYRDNILLEFKQIDEADFISPVVSTEFTESGAGTR